MKKKKILNPAFLILLQLICSICIAQDIQIDATTFDGKKREVSTDFKKTFVLEFINNKQSKTKIGIMSSDLATQNILKSEITNQDKPSIKFTFNPSADGRSVEVKPENSTPVSISSSKLQLFYGKNVIVVSNQGTAAPPPPAPPQKNNPNSSTFGIEIHDAILAKQYYSTDKKALLILLGSIKNIDTKVIDLETPVKEAWKNNPFISELLKTTEFKALGNDMVNNSQGGIDLKSFASSIGNTDVTTIADGIARFLVKRTKQELNIAFFQRFKDLINDEKYKDAQILFPKTMETLNTIDQQIYLFENYITTLRESFEKDLSLILDNMPKVIEEGTFKDYFTSKPNIKYSLLLTLFTGRECVNGTHPGKILESLPEDYLHAFKNSDGTENKTVSGTFQTLQLLSKSLRSKIEDKYWTSLDTIQMLYKNDDKLIAAKFYLGFLYENAVGISFNNNKSLQDYLKTIVNTPDDIKKYITFIKELGKKCHDVESAITQIKIKKTDVAPIDVYNRLFTSFADVVEHINGLGSLPGMDVNSKITDAVTKYLKIFRQTNDLALNVVQKNYGSAIMNAYNIYLAATEVKKGPAQTVDKKKPNTELFAEVKKEANPKDQNKTDLKENETANGNAITTSDFIKKYGNFMANVVKAKNSEEVSAAIESVALPVGSASIKKHNSFSIALNAYVGLYLGSEKIGGVDDKYKINAYGITAPIGISISKGWNWDKKGGWSSSLFFSIIDVGAPVAFRFKDDKTEQIPTIQLKDIISPGIFISTGFPNVPISMNLGWQMGPVLRKIDAAVADKASSNYSRFSIAFLVDIPVLNFYTKTH